MMKKIISVILVAIVLLSCVSISVCAANDGVIKAGRISAKRGEEISIPINFENNPGVYIIRVTVTYDERVAEYIEINKTASDSFNYTVNENENSIVVLMDGQKMSNITGDFEMFALFFKVTSDAPIGRALFTVTCEDGMATALVKEGKKLKPVPFSPSTSTGAVTIICSEHTFDVQLNDGGFQCSKCGATKTKEDKIEVDTDAGLPEIDASASSVNSESQPDQSVLNQSVPEAKDDEDGLKIGHFIPFIAAAIIAVLIPVSIVVFKKRKSITDSTDDQE
jgi:hypothetical protein